MMTVTKFFCIAFLVACITLLSFSGFGGGTTEPESGEKTGFAFADHRKFEMTDASRDGLVTGEEAKNRPLAADFSQVDKNQDGQISPFEYEQAEPALSPHRSRPNWAPD